MRQKTSEPDEKAHEDAIQRLAEELGRDPEFIRKQYNRFRSDLEKTTCAELVPLVAARRTREELTAVK